MEITLKNYQKKVPIPRGMVLKAAKAALRKLRLETGGLSIVFAGTKRMAVINKKYLGHGYATDVLAFNYGDTRRNPNYSLNSGYVGCPLISEIIICPQIARINARKHQTSTEKEIVLYVIHGILHLAGYDDHCPEDILEMRKMENLLITRL